MIVFQEIVTGNQKYSFSNQPNLTVFDMHNDSPYNMGVSFGNDTGIGNADYYTSPHSILIGIGPTGKGQRSVGGVRWSGTVYLYTQTPMGGGTTNLASAPAQQITVIGYATGYNPTGTTSLNRMNNVANPVNTVGGSASALQNDNNIAGTVIMEASVSADPSSAVRLTNDAQLTLGTGLDPASVTIITQNGTITIAKTGIVTLPYFLFVDLIQAIAGNDIKIFADALKSFIVTVGSTDTFSVNSTGPSLLAGSFKFLAGSISRVSMFTAGVSTVPTFFNHGLGAIPDLVLVSIDGAVAGTFSCIVDYASLTSTQVKLTGSINGMNVHALAIKF